ncbi:MAG: Dam family site-specific DNA-(adenine-N6)-methyltransferase, partial [bacterium]
MKSRNNISIPHPFPYQGSKRKIASKILRCFPNNVECLIEPFCGAAAVSIAAAVHNLAKSFYLNDLNEPLMKLWKEILESPNLLANQYKQLWDDQHSDRKEFFNNIREKFNLSQEPYQLLYLLARIVKGSVRYSAEGTFNQSADNRRSGMRPRTMMMQIFGVSALLKGRTKISAVDFRQVFPYARKQDLIYMDPPYQGTSFTRDHRYYGGLSFDEFVDSLYTLNDAQISYIISYDGQTGNKSHGLRLPDELSLKHLHIHAGRSTQATLLGSHEDTIESLYLSPALVERLGNQESKRTELSNVQQEL